MSHLVFVYGTLKKGYPNHHLLEDGAAFLGERVTMPEFTMHNIHGAYPAVELHGETAIHGELYSVTSDVFKDLDHLEGYPEYYNRCKVQLHGMEKSYAWMYYMEMDVLGQYDVIESGKWEG